MTTTFGQFLQDTDAFKYPTHEHGAMVLEEGVVYCHEHGAVHDDSIDPYGYGEADCRRAEHRRVYWKAKRGDYK